MNAAQPELPLTGGTGDIQHCVRLVTVLDSVPESTQPRRAVPIPAAGFGSRKRGVTVTELNLSVRGRLEEDDFYGHGSTA